MDDVPTAGADDGDDDRRSTSPPGDGVPSTDHGDDLANPVQGGRRAGDDIVDLPWDELPTDRGDDTTAEAGDTTGGPGQDDGADDGADAADLGELSDHDHVAGRRNALPRRVESWRSRSASGAVVTAIALGLQQVFEPERRRPAAVAEAPSDPYDDDDPITVDYVPDDAEATTVHVKPWLLKGDPS